MKKIVKDYQWPSFFISLKQKYLINLEKNDSSQLINKLENYFEKYYGYKIILFPSARAGIASILRFLKIDRTNEVFVNRWVSHCIFNTVGRYTNITTIFKKPDVALAVHKWGIKQIITKNKKLKIIEDSVDTILLKKNDLFPNNGDFEIVSLPKIIGSISGGIIITKDTNFYKFAKKEQVQNKNLGEYQSRRKFDDVNKKKSFNTWLYHESTNTYLEHNALLNISKCLKNFQINKNIISERQRYFKKKFNMLAFKLDRLGPVIPIDYSLIKNHKLMNEHFLLRHIHKNRYEIENFKKVYLLPVHFKITVKKFKFYLTILEKSIL